MSTAAICGYSGTIASSGGALEITNWEVTLTVDTPEATSMASAGWKERVPCLKGATGNFRCLGASSTVGLHAGAIFKTAPADGMSISGDIIISRITVGTPVDGLVSFAHEFTFTGDITATIL